ncbi:MAG: nucleotidyl transferase AbiEii/AbiGii toxin family protein [Nocardioides sp.]|nr:nucleotidyl transferase AbiEii/AbiGii toxin family protein [Nocardioides sp.]
MPLSSGQERAAAILLSASGSRMALGGGGALIAHGLVDRDSEDLDAFIDSREDFRTVANRIRTAFQGANYEISDNDSLGDPSQILTWYVRPRKTATRGRPTLPVKIQLLRDPILLDPVPGRFGPMIDPVELGAQKLTVIYEDARPRDYDDLARIATHYRLGRIIEVADERHFQALDRPTIATTLRQVARMRAADIPEGCGLQALVTYYDSVAGPIATGDLGHASSLPTPYSSQWSTAGTSGREPADGGSPPDVTTLQRYLLQQSQQRRDPPSGPSEPPTSSPSR